VILGDVRVHEAADRAQQCASAEPHVADIVDCS
jgi:hypothetical protein